MDSLRYPQSHFISPTADASDGAVGVVDVQSDDLEAVEGGGQQEVCDDSEELGEVARQADGRITDKRGKHPTEHCYAKRSESLKVD